MVMRHRVISDFNEPELHFLVNHFAEQLRTTAPMAVLLDDDDAVIYTTGSPAYLVISEGSLQRLSNEEFERRIRQEIRFLGANLASPAVH